MAAVFGGTGMDMGLDETTLRRIIARLVSFAALAERAAGRCFPVRWLVLAILRHAEGATLGYLADTTGLTGPPPSRTTRKPAAIRPLP
jgi:hypothetical protein